MNDRGWQGIAPASGWLAVFVGVDRNIYTERVALWAWKREVDVDDTIFDAAVGVLGRQSMEEVEYADDSDYFLGYIHESEDPQVYAASIDDVFKRIERRRQQREKKS